MLPSSAADRPQYAELAPSASLAPWVECYWTMDGVDDPSRPNRVLPDGCADIILGLPDCSGPVAVGTMATAAVFRRDGPVSCFGVRFRPGCALPFLDLPLREITDRRVPLDALWGREAELLADVSRNERRSRVERVLADRLRRWSADGRSDETLVARAIELMRRTRGGASVGGVAAALGTGERRLERAFDRNVGVGPKLFGRILRFRRALHAVDAGSGARAVDWAAVAFGAGYCDQSHLIREFRAFAGTTPTRYFAQRNAVGFIQYEEPAAM